MRKVSLLFAAVAIVSVLSVVSSCKKNNETPVKPKLSFSSATKTVKESDGTISITMTLDNPSPEAVSVSYELSGTADDQVTDPNTADYNITSSYLECKIKKGETTGTITIELFSDFLYEDDETILIHIKDTDSDNIEITRDDDIAITVKQEDGLGIFLDWGVGTGENYTDVDMDLMVWSEDNTGTLQLTNLISADEGFTSPEFVFIASALADEGDYGLSCNYYAGTVDPMNFVVTFIPWINGASGTEVTRNGSYHLENINPWYDSHVNPLLALTFKKTGTTFTDFSQITVQATGSRVGSTGKIPYELRGKSLGMQRETILRKLKH